MTRIPLPEIMRRLLRRRDGVAALEFALAFPIVLTAVMGIMEFSMILFVSALLEGGLRDASRFGITGTLPDGMTRQEKIVEIVNDRSLGLFTLTTADVRMRVYDSFEQIGQPEPFVNDVNGNHQCDPGDTYTDINGNAQWDSDMAKSGAGDSSSVVVYDVVANWPLLTPLLSAFIGQDGEMPVAASIAVRNEPYAPGGSTPSPSTLTCGS